MIDMNFYLLILIIMCFIMLLMKDDDIVFDIGEAAHYLKVSEQTIYKLLRRGELAGAKVGREWRTHKSAVIDFLHAGNEPKKKGGRPGKRENRRATD